nr:hypothetical protein [Tanacetum cinerariifolium]
MVPLGRNGCAYFQFEDLVTSLMVLLSIWIMSRWLWSRFIQHSTVSPVKGLYFYGRFCTGKTMLMDLFYDQVPQRHRGFSDPLEAVERAMFDESVLLCLDGFMQNAWI